jgi:hypothetical protein
VVLQGCYGLTHWQSFWDFPAQFLCGKWCHGFAIGDGIISLENIPQDLQPFLSHQKLGAATVQAMEEEILGIK